jgi:hypothetical protein
LFSGKRSCVSEWAASARPKRIKVGVFIPRHASVKPGMGWSHCRNALEARLRRFVREDDERERGAGRKKPKAAAVPATVSGERSADSHWAKVAKTAVREGGGDALTREPGDLPPLSLVHGPGPAQMNRTSP